jgi:hypothetical protein
MPLILGILITAGVIGAVLLARNVIDSASRP